MFSYKLRISNDLYKLTQAKPAGGLRSLPPRPHATRAAHPCLMPLAGADVVPEAEVGRFPLRIGTVLFALRFGLSIVLRVVDYRIPVAAGEHQHRQGQQAEPKRMPRRRHAAILA